MATAKGVSSRRVGGSRKWPWAVLAVFGALAIIVTLKASDWVGQIKAGSGYNAAVVCMCRYQGNRTLESCEGDMQNIASAIQVSENTDEKTIHAGVPMVAGATARFDPEFGCVLE